MNKQQAIEDLKLRLTVLDDLGQAGSYSYSKALEALAVLDDTYNGFSNRETWEAYTCLAKVDTWAHRDFHRYAMEAIQRGDLKYLADLGSRVGRSDIGSLWRVDWDEVAEALKGRR